MHPSSELWPDLRNAVSQLDQRTDIRRKELLRGKNTDLNNLSSLSTLDAHLQVVRQYFKFESGRLFTKWKALHQVSELVPGIGHLTFGLLVSIETGPILLLSCRPDISAVIRTKYDDLGGWIMPTQLPLVYSSAYNIGFMVLLIQMLPSSISN